MGCDGVCCPLFELSIRHYGFLCIYELSLGIHGHTQTHSASLQCLEVSKHSHGINPNVMRI
eukprot:scaffold59807_cov31-Cyclotella_meneghiniana.AAC.4